MTANLSKFDRIFRFFLGLALFFAPLINVPAIWASSTAAALAMIVGFILMATGMMKFCPLYKVLGVSTCRN